MALAKVWDVDQDIDARLKELFDVSRAELFLVVREVVGARADAVEDDPAFSEGMFGHIHGVRNTRALLRTKGWIRENKSNLALVRHPEKPLKVGFQAVDVACNPEHVPQAVSGKGAGARRVLDEAQLTFLSVLDHGRNDLGARTESGGLWYFCVSVQGDDVRAELSLCSEIEDDNFASFIERIFVLRKGEWGDIGGRSKAVPDDGEGGFEIEPTVRRK